MRAVASDDAVTLLDSSVTMRVLIPDGWAPHGAYNRATHQSCVAHLTCRVRGAEGGAATFQNGFLTQIGES